ncbi:MAG: cyclic nucleotide-binding domain-containing protein [Arcobacteraceae bacterium]|nr:cyclic nucleotide-binding domain-containing protein [Arcobacteraceae bacterium]
MVDNSALEQLIRAKNKINFFKDLTDYQIQTLIKDIVFKKLNRHETIFRQGETRDPYIYYVLAGSVKVNLRDDYGVTKTVTTLPVGSIIGEMQIVLNQERTASCVANNEENILIGFTINEYQLGQHGNIYAVFYRNIAEVLARKIEDTNKKIK